MELLTIGDTAQILKVNPVTVPRYIADGRLPVVKVGKGVRVRKEAVEQFITPVETKRPRKAASARRGKLFTKDDSLFNIIGIAKGSADGVTDVSENKYKYLAEAYAPKSE